MGKNIVHQGDAGAGQHTKMCNQITIAGTMIGVCEALIYGYKAGLKLENPTFRKAFQEVQDWQKGIAKFAEFVLDIVLGTI